MITEWKRPAVIAAAFLAVAGAFCWLAGLSPALPVVVAGLAYLAVRPLPGLVYVLVVLVAPLGLWMLRVEWFLGWVFGGRDYALSLSAAAVACTLLVVTLIRRPPSRRQLLIAGAGLLVTGVGALVGIMHHGFGQTAVGGRLLMLPIVLAVVAAGLSERDLRRLVTVTAWLVVANAVATVAEVLIGPDQLVLWGFEVDRAIRIIGDTFRAPGLTEFNAELGMLAGAYLLGYVALWISRDLRPRAWSWHAGAASAALCLVLSTSRSGALLLVGGLVAAVVLNRAGGPAARRRARLLGAAVVACVVAGFAALGAVGSTSTFDRLDNWAALLRDAPLAYGWGLGGAGAATTSRVVGAGHQIFVDNYFLSIALQFGVPVLVVVLGLAGWGLLRLSRGSAAHPAHVVHLALLAGLLCGSLMIETWEYTGAMMVLAVFAAYAQRTAAAADPDVAPAPQRREPSAAVGSEP
ncbi:hypothetical protein [Actinoplanes teichomyceticus]|uniref:O-antigen ligase n=1 Tax=Actinoplanes teichomyceticus TaxID=1867 RepID=A0A561WL15_ACTTI|nr:hypothetical protein [Actinoplanes teichomyceticus]TWG24530.1 hypothetical protein FHX34_1021090 [Actinoplanes teichomyceticus]GIF16827.1 hypothetical protein Ate01nite_68590 [Actinoplanes teichomyceticus]